MKTVVNRKPNGFTVLKIKARDKESSKNNLLFHFNVKDMLLTNYFRSDVSEINRRRVQCGSERFGRGSIKLISLTLNKIN